MNALFSNGQHLASTPAPWSGDAHFTPEHITSAHSDATFLSLKQLVKQFGQTCAVDSLSLTVQRGEIFALLGSSGCGKSTLLRMLAGFETPDSGQILLNGQNIVDLPPYRRPINMMFQSYALFPHLSVWENIAFGLKRDGLSRDEIAVRVEQMLALVLLGGYDKRKPHQLSGGQQQRVALARSLARQPQLLLLDEPLAALDKKLRERTQLELVNIIRQVGVTCVMVTHDQEEAMAMASRIGVMNEGKLKQIGAPGEIYETPDSRFVAEFIGNVNIFTGQLIVKTADHSLFHCTDCQIHLTSSHSDQVNQLQSLAIRPEKITLSNQSPDHPYNFVRGQICQFSYFGSYTVYHLRLSSGQLIKVSASNISRHSDFQPRHGDSLYASWNSDAVVLLSQ